MNKTVTTNPRTGQCQKPSGWLGRIVLWNMNSRHSKVTDWGLSRLPIQKHHVILDVGCGGGRAVSKLAALATDGKVFGLDYSETSVAFASKINRSEIEGGRVEIRKGSVSKMPFQSEMFNVVTAIETHIWWPDLAGDMREVRRILKPGGILAVIAEVYRGANTTTARMAEKYQSKTGMNLLTIDEHRELLIDAGYSEIQIDAEPDKGWICCIGKKPLN